MRYFATLLIWYVAFAFALHSFYEEDWSELVAWLIIYVAGIFAWVDSIKKIKRS